MTKINVGGQKSRKKLRHHQNEWKMVDVREGADYIVNIMEEPLPFKNDSIEAVYTSHTLEHILPHKMRFVMSELHRVLRPNHRIRIVVPDIDIAINAYVKKDTKFLRRGENPGKMGYLPDMDVCYLSSWFFTYREQNDFESSGSSGGHVMAFNFQLLSFYLNQAGFSNIVRLSHDKCDAIFGGCDIVRHKDTSLYVEALKL